MKVLLLSQDLFLNIGGGQTVYRRIIEATPEVEFYYYRAGEPEVNPLRPANAKALPLSPLTPAGFQLYSRANPLMPPHHLRALNQVADYAKSVAGQSFDIVESPDYETFGGFIRDVFNFYRVRIGRVVLAMHGNISTSIRLNWNPGEALDLEELETRQFRAADGVYSLSKAYMEKWTERVPRNIEYLEPLNFVNRPAKLPDYRPRPSRKPNLCCIGRLEKLKGHDIFLELARWLPKELYHRPLLIGDNDPIPGGQASDRLYGNAVHRGWERIYYLGRFSQTQLSTLYAGKNLIILPVRADSFNLVTLEALFRGCPVAVSDRAGVCEYLDSEWPKLPYVKIDFSNLYGCLPELRDLLKNYDDYREELTRRLKENTAPLSGLDMAATYQRILGYSSGPARESFDLAIRRQYRRYFSNIIWFNIPQSLKPGLRSIRKQGDELFSSFRHAVRARLRKRSVYPYLPTVARYPSALRFFSGYPENTKAQLKDKLTHLYNTAESAPLMRAWFWSEIARLEDLRKKPLYAAAYKLRVMRLMGDDRFSWLPGCADSLKALKYDQEAAAATALYEGRPEESAQNVYQYLVEAREKHREKSAQPYELLEDHRDSLEPKVSVIVSLYNAAPKLRFFLTSLAQQTLVRAGKVEFIIQDSASPLDEKMALDSVISQTPLSVVYGRSTQRETIQSAWNRGIKLARAPYLVFLGVDETLYPEALELLAARLDARPHIDWVMSDSQVTEVDAKGILKNDVMTYNRREATKDHVYLETCYLSWVGGMYRKNIHDRFGYYDETFRGAGDTEFKNRILPDIEVEFLPMTLGLFLNYPEERTTASPSVEIEDSRAWYLHRTLGGVRYAFENRPLEDLKAQLLRTLGYQKSYCGHLSTDFDYGVALARYGYERSGDKWWPSILADLTSLRNILLTFEYGQKAGRLSVRQYIAGFKEAERIEREHRSRLGDETQPTYRLFNDNRYEQHSWLWKSI